MARQNVQHDTCGMDVVGQGFCARGLDGVQAIVEHGGEDIDHLPFTAGSAFQLTLHAADRNR